MKTLLTAAIVIPLVMLGCRRHAINVDITPPATPRGLETFAGDGFAEIWWEDNTERDLSGYNIYVASSPHGSFTLIGRTGSTDFIDGGAKNGRTYYYGVAAYDFDGNESDLTVDVIGTTPRPEGYEVVLFNYLASPNSAGYDFSSNTIGPYDDDYTDVFFEYSYGVAYMDVWDDSDIQDMGYTSSLDEIREAPNGGWASTKDVQVIPGHTYVVWTWDNHYAKIRVASVTSQRVTFDWAYQLQAENPFLKHNTKGGTHRGSLTRIGAQLRI
jgi:hypothetical protein